MLAVAPFGEKGYNKKLTLSRSKYEFSDNRLHDLIPESLAKKTTGSFSSVN
jgi:hypothetical protein